MALTPDQIFNQIKKFDSKLTRSEFDASFKSNPDAVMQIYESVKPRSFIGSSIQLPDGSSATVKRVKHGAKGGAGNVFAVDVVTDKGTYVAYDKDFLSKGNYYDSTKRQFFPHENVLDALQAGKSTNIPVGLFTDLKNAPDGRSGELVLIADPKINSRQGFNRLDRGDRGRLDVSLTKAPNGNFVYLGGGGNRIESMYGTRAGDLGITGGVLPNGGNVRSIEIKKKGGFLGSIGSTIGKVLDNPLVKLGVSALVPGGAGLVGAFEAGKIGGGLATGQLSFGDALKGVATAAAAQGIGSLSKGLSGAVSDAIGGAAGNIAGNVAQGAIKGGAGSLLSGGNLGQGILGGALSGGINSGIKEAFGATGSFLDKLNRENAPLGTGLIPGAGGQTGVTPPSNFDIAPNVGNNLPSTLGFLANVPGLGSLFDNMKFPTTGLNPGTVGNLDFGSGTGQGLQVPSSPTLPGGLGQGLTVGVPGGTLGQGGVTPTGQINLGDPNSFINGGTQGTATPGPDISKLIKGLLGLGGAAAVARGLGSLGGPNQQVPAQSNPGGVANIPDPLERDLGFQFQAPEYTAGLGGQLLQPVNTSPLLLPSVQAPNYLRQFAEGGQVEAMNSGLGALPMGGRFLEGPGDGMSDDIPANIDGEEPVMLTDGEYIIPAQAVSALGNGSSKAGAKVLDDMVKRVYTQQTGKPKQMKPINKRVLAA